MEAVDVVEDAVGLRRRAVSISSVDSEPLVPLRRSPKPRPNGDVSGTAPQESAHAPSASGQPLTEANLALVASKADTARDDDDGVDGNDNSGHGDNSDDGRSDQGPTGNHAAATVVDLADVNYARLAAAGQMGLTAEAAAQETIDINAVSEAPVAVVSSVMAKSCTLVAENLPGCLLLEIGTRLCMANGAVIGIIATILGPVTSCSYAVIGDEQHFPKLLSDHGLCEGTMLCYDLGHQRVIFNPSATIECLKGTDASYVNDEELPANARPDFSDDEEERQWKRSTKRSGGGSVMPLAVVSSAQGRVVAMHQIGRRGGCGSATAYQALGRGRGRGGPPILTDDLDGCISSDESNHSFTEQEMAIMVADEDAESVSSPAKFHRWEDV